MIIIGHRGARGLAPENTLAAIKKGISYNVDEVEVDVRVTRDGVVILSHDQTLTTDNGTKSIASHTYQELRDFKADITTLAEALKSTADRTVLLIEVKRGEPVAPVIQAVEQYTSLSRKSPQIMFGSKSYHTLKALHQALPKVPLVVIEPWSGVRASYRARKLGTKRISMRSWWLWEGFLKSMALRGFLIVPYTMNKPHKVAKWAPYIYGVVTDYPDRFTHISKKS